MIMLNIRRKLFFNCKVPVMVHIPLNEDEESDTSGFLNDVSLLLQIVLY